MTGRSKPACPLERTRHWTLWTRTGLLFVISTAIGAPSGLANTAWGQALFTREAQPPGPLCPHLEVRAGESVPLDCRFSSDGFVQWTSKDPQALEYLSDLSDPAPRFQAPAGLSTVRQFTFHPVYLDPDGRPAVRAPVQVTVYPEGTEDCPGSDHPRATGAIARCPSYDPLEPEAALTEEPGARNAFPQGPDRRKRPATEAPRLVCAPSITVDSGAEAVLACTGYNPTGGLLEYTAEFGWPPFSESVVLAGGDLEYSVRAPVITDAAEVQWLELTAEDPQTGLTGSQTVEVHIVNTKPALQCRNLIVEEGEAVAFPCTTGAAHPVKYQFLPQTGRDVIPWGIYDRIPEFVVPDVSRDTTFTVLVRALEAGRVAQQELTIVVQDTDRPASPLDLRIECHPAVSEVYEGWDDIQLECSVTSRQDGDFVWTWAAEGNTPLDPILLSFDSYSARIATFHVPASVDEDLFFEYSVIASSTDLGVSNRATIFITVLERPDLFVDCEDAHVHVGDPPVELSCTATNDKSLELVYTWDWQPTDRLIGDVTASGTPLFDVPAEQDELTRDYVYEVTATAPDADAPDRPAALTVTVEKILGTLTLACTTPIEVYEGASDLALDCTVGQVLPDANLAWVWQPLQGTEDRLRANPDRFRGPIFQVPASVPNDQTFEYALAVEAPHYIGSPSVTVTITVRAQPELALNCEPQVTVQVGEAPRTLHCEVTNDKGLDLDYTWAWTPTTRLSDYFAATPLFEVPAEQRAVSTAYRYAITVRAPHSIPATATLNVVVNNPDALRSFQVGASVSPVAFGRIGAFGVARLDPGLERLSGLAYGGAVHAGRLWLTAQDSLELGVELLGPAVLRRTGEADISRASPELNLAPLWSYAASCSALASENRAETSLHFGMEKGDCHLLRFGGEVALDQAPPGTYTGALSVLVTLGHMVETHSVPVSLDVEPVQRAVLLGPSRAQFGLATLQSGVLESDQIIEIDPLVAVLSAQAQDGTLNLSNPSIVPLEVTVTTEFGYLEAPEGPGTPSVFLTNAELSPLGDLSDRITVHPNILLLMPGEIRQVRYAIEEVERAHMGERGYAVSFNLTAEPRQYVGRDQQPRPARGRRTARVSTRIPGVYVPGTGARPLSAELESLSGPPDQDLKATFLIETQDVPFVGQVAVHDGRGVELGRSDLLVYTRSRVRVLLDSTPGENVTLQFIPHTETPAPPSVRITVDQ